MHRTLEWGQHSMVSIGFQELCLSPRVAMDHCQKLINLFISKTKESACICITVVIDIIIAMSSIQHRFIILIDLSTIVWRVTLLRV